MKAKRKDQEGALLLELLIAMVVIGVLGLGIANSMWTVHSIEVVNRRNFSALQLANEKMEAVALTNPELLDDSAPQTEVVVKEGVSFLRTTTVSIMPSRSRRVTIMVETVNASDRGGSAELESSFSLWGRR
jgi:type II secretory pathway pseudopilin PulG